MEARSERRASGKRIAGLTCYDPIPWGKAHIWVSADTDTVRAVVGKGKTQQELDPALVKKHGLNIGEIMRAMDDAGYPATGRAIIIPWKANEGEQSW